MFSAFRTIWKYIGHRNTKQSQKLFDEFELDVVDHNIENIQKSTKT